MHANKREEIDKVYSGDIAATVRLKNVTTGDTLCDEKNEVIGFDGAQPQADYGAQPTPKSGNSDYNAAPGAGYGAMPGSADDSGYSAQLETSSSSLSRDSGSIISLIVFIYQKALLQRRNVVNRS